MGLVNIKISKDNFKGKSTLGKNWCIWFHINFNTFVNSNIKGKWQPGKKLTNNIFNL